MNLIYHTIDLSILLQIRRVLKGHFGASISSLYPSQSVSSENIMAFCLESVFLCVLTRHYGTSTSTTDSIVSLETMTKDKQS